MNNTNYIIHPYCFLFTLPSTANDMAMIDCTEQAKQSEVHNDDGFIYSEYKQTGVGKRLKVGYRYPKGFTPVTADRFLVEVLVDDSEGRTYGSIVAGTILSPTEITPAMHIQCGDRANGGDPRIVEATRASLTYTTAATMKLCLSPKLKQVIHIAGPDGSLPWSSSCAGDSLKVKINLGDRGQLCDDPSKQAGTIASFLDLDSYSVKLVGVEIDEGKLAVAA